MASNVVQENNEENDISSHKNPGKVSQLKFEVDALTQENSELFLLLQNERRKSKLLQSELELGSQQENSWEKSTNEDAAITAGNGETTETFLQNVVLMLKEKLESKESECEELEDKLSVMNQELASQGEELARATLQSEYQIKHLHQLLAQERDLNSLLSDESDQTVRELQTIIHEKDDLNTELKVIKDETSERMQNIEEECRFFQTKLCDTEKQLSSIVSEHEHKVAIETDSVSCQVSESELHGFQEREHALHESDEFYAVFMAVWGSGDIVMNRLGVNRYKMDIFKLIRNGFRKLRENALV